MSQDQPLQLARGKKRKKRFRLEMGDLTYQKVRPGFERLGQIGRRSQVSRENKFEGRMPDGQAKGVKSTIAESVNQCLQVSGRCRLDLAITYRMDRRVFPGMKAKLKRQEIRTDIGCAQPVPE